MKNLFLNACLTVFIISCAQKNSDRTESNKKEVLLYLSVRNGNYDIYKNDLRGDESLLTQNSGYDYAPMYNSELKKVIYCSYVQDSFLIAAKDLDGNDVSLETYRQTEFNLSPNAEKLIHKVQIGDTSILVLSDTMGKKRDTISQQGEYNGRAQWSWESDKIAYISDKDGNNEVYVYDLILKESYRITENETPEKYITWEPGGNRLAYTTQYYEEGKPDRNDLFVYDLTNNKATQITFNQYNDSEIAWSPLSGQIAFHSKRDSIDHIFFMNSDGTNVRKITTTNAYHGEPNWALISNK